MNAEVAVDDDRALPFVSVAVPVRNGEGELRHTLLNLLKNARYPRSRYEVLMGDHGSTDQTRAIIEAFQVEYSNLRRIPVPFESSNRAVVRNQLIRESAGEIIIFIDHDVLVSDDFIAAHVRAHQRAPHALVAGLTFGKGVFRQDIDKMLAEVDMDHVTNSYDRLADEPALADFRTRAGLAEMGALVDVGGIAAPFRLFWTCNVSAPRGIVQECGGFDERYDGWGVEDDDFAQALRVRDARLLFSREAWGLHVPHPVNQWKNLAEWRTNFSRFFDKFGTRELEYYGLYGHQVGAAMERPEGTLKRVQRLDVSSAIDSAKLHLGAPRGTRLGLVIPDATAASDLRLTHGCCPFVPANTLPYAEAGVQFWSLLGVRLPFADVFVDELVLLVDTLKWLDRALLTLVLHEAARVAKHVFFCLGATSQEAYERAARETFADCASLVQFAGTTWVQDGRTRPSPPWRSE